MQQQQPADYYDAVAMSDRNFAANEIIKDIWLGSHDALTHLLEAKDISLVITAITEYELKRYGIRKRVGNRNWIWIPMDDNQDGDIIRFFSASNTAIDLSLASGKPVLIHCAAGVSRSATLVIAYLMWRSGLSWKDAFDPVQKRRPIIDPNGAFIEQLDLYEDFLTNHHWMPRRNCRNPCSLSTDATESTT